MTAHNKAIEGILLEGEHIVERGEIHPGLYWQSAAVFALGIVVGALVAFPLGVLLGATGLIMFAHAAIKAEILLLVLTNKRIFVRYGILQVDVVDIRFSKIESLELARMLPGYLMGYADVVITGTGQRVIVIPYIGNAVEFRQAYNRVTLAGEGL